MRANGTRKHVNEQKLRKNDHLTLRVDFSFRRHARHYFLHISRCGEAPLEHRSCLDSSEYLSDLAGESEPRFCALLTQSTPALLHRLQKSKIVRFPDTSPCVATSAVTQVARSKRKRRLQSARTKCERPSGINYRPTVLNYRPTVLNTIASIPSQKALPHVPAASHSTASRCKDT